MKQPNKIWGQASATLSPSSLSALRLKYVLSDLKSVEGKVLEVGCGAGMFAIAIKKALPSLEVYGTDLNKEAIKKALKNSSGVNFKYGDVMKLPYKDKIFDAVVSFDVLEHLEDPSAALSEISRVLKKGGLLHIFVPIEGYLLTLPGILRKLGYLPKIKYAGHIQQYKRDEFKNYLRKAGFKINRVFYSSHLFMQIIDSVYFLIISLTKIEIDNTIEGYISKGNKNIWINILNLAKSSIATLSYFESSLLKNLPGQGMHSSCKKT